MSQYNEHVLDYYAHCIAKHARKACRRRPRKVSPAKLLDSLNPFIQ